MYPSHDESAVHRVANYVSFGLAAAVLGSVAAKRPDVIYAWHPPLTTGLAAVVLSLTKRAPFVYDIQDMWPDTLAATGMVQDRRILAAVAAIARFVYRRAAHIAVQSPGFRDTLVSRGVASEKVDVIFNWAHEGELKIERDPAIAAQMANGEKFNVVFAGTMGKAQGLETVLDAAELIKETHPGIQFVLAGGGIEVESLRTAASERGLGNVRFLGRMPVSRIGAVMEAADVLLIHLKDLPLFEITIPNKAQDYLFAGKPVLIAGRGDSARLIEKSGGGLVCQPGNPRALAETVSRLFEMPGRELQVMGDRGRAFYEKELSLNVGVTKFVSVFDRQRSSRKGP